MNKQPFYHRAVVLFTATTSINQEEFEEILRDALRFSSSKDILLYSIECEEIDDEPGDPADLIGDILPNE